MVFCLGKCWPSCFGRRLDTEEEEVEVVIPPKKEVRFQALVLAGQPSPLSNIFEDAMSSSLSSSSSSDDEESTLHMHSASTEGSHSSSQEPREMIQPVGTSVGESSDVLTDTISLPSSSIDAAPSPPEACDATLIPVRLSLRKCTYSLMDGKITFQMDKVRAFDILNPEKQCGCGRSKQLFIDEERKFWGMAGFQLHGQVKMVDCCSPAIYEGNFSEGLPNGEGMLMTEQGIKYKVIYSFGKLLEMNRLV